MRYNDSVRVAIRATRNYWRGCTFERLKTEAMKDHKQALNEIIKRGFTWGLKHQLPFEWENLKKGDVIAIRNSLFPRRSNEYNSSYSHNKNRNKRNEIRELQDK